ncbi:MAG TPA: hypothetical protein VFM62_03215 [Arthrobacter sp.]|nr:hypothetical protein [Arthrobacter sp.]
MQARSSVIYPRPGWAAADVGALAGGGFPEGEVVLVQRAPGSVRGLADPDGAQAGSGVCDLAAVVDAGTSSDLDFIAAVESAEASNTFGKGVGRFLADVFS